MPITTGNAPKALWGEKEPKAAASAASVVQKIIRANQKLTAKKKPRKPTFTMGAFGH